MGLIVAALCVRSIMLGELIEAHMHLSSLFKGIDEKYDPILDRKAREELQVGPITTLFHVGSCSAAAPSN